MSKLNHHHHQQVDVAALTSSTELYVAYSSPTDAQTDIMLNAPLSTCVSIVLSTIVMNTHSLAAPIKFCTIHWLAA